MEFKKTISLSSFLEIIGYSFSDVENLKYGSENLFLDKICSPHLTSKNCIVFLNHKIKGGQLPCLPSLAFVEEVTGKEIFPFIKIVNARLVLSKCLQKLKSRFKKIDSSSLDEGIIYQNREFQHDLKIHSSSIVEGQVHESVKVGPQCFVAKNTFLGKGVILEAGVIIHENVLIGSHTYIQSGVIIGGAGFGFMEEKQMYQRIPHFAGVVIGTDCWIGSNTVICAGILEPTTIGSSCYFDTLIQIAHNVTLGDYARMASQSGIAGSTHIGKHFTIGGNSSVAGHLNLGDKVTVAACSGVTKSIKSNQTVGGFPAQDLNKWKRQQVLLRLNKGSSKENSLKK